METPYDTRERERLRLWAPYLPRHERMSEAEDDTDLEEFPRDRYDEESLVNLLVLLSQQVLSRVPSDVMARVMSRVQQRLGSESV